MIIEYSSNNSGGHWWLTDENWKKLEAAGWKVVWKTLDYDYKGGACQYDEEGFPKLKPAGKEGFVDSDGRWLGALATKAYRKCNSMTEAIREFEKITEKNACEEGCNCCGPPHCFSVLDGAEYASGEELLKYLYDDVPSTLREATERLKKEKS